MGLFAIGKENTWQKDGATVTLFQVVIGFAVVLAILIAIVTRDALSRGATTRRASFYREFCLVITA